MENSLNISSNNLPKAVGGEAVSASDTLTAPQRIAELDKMGYAPVQHATAFTTDQALLQAEDFARKSAQFQKNVAAARANRELFVDPVEIPLVEMFGSDYKGHVRGVSRLGSKQAPTGQASTDFSGGTLESIK